jgi:type II secretory pathway component GspD/PulD (secretin)
MGGYDGSNRLNDVWRSIDQGATWTQMTAAAEWTARSTHTSVALPDGSLVLMGGSGSWKNDVWRSIDQGATWTQMTAAAEWSGRFNHTSVALPDGGIVLMGGYDGSRRNDIWRSTDQGATWTQVTAAAEWPARYGHTSVALPDGSIVLIGGFTGSKRLNDVWRWETAGSSEQHPIHTYTELGTYSVALQVYNSGGFSSLIREAYINVTDTETYWLNLPLVLRSIP